MLLEHGFRICGSVFFNFFAVIIVCYFLLLIYFFFLAKFQLSIFSFYRGNSHRYPPVAGSARLVCRKMDSLSLTFVTPRQRLSDVSSKIMPLVKKEIFFLEHTYSFKELVLLSGLFCRYFENTRIRRRAVIRALDRA